MLRERVLAMKARALRSRQLGDPKAGGIWQESFAQTEGEPEVIRHAKALAHYYRHQDVVIREGELVVGCTPGLTADSVDEITPAIFGRRTWEPPGRDYWPVPPETEPHWREGILAPAGNHTTLDYETVFAVGFEGLIDRIDGRLGRLSDPDLHGRAAHATVDVHERAAHATIEEKQDFLQALRIIAEGFIDLSNRYAEQAEAMAEAEDDPVRRGELETIARNCRRVPVKAPTTFWEACQCAWFSFFFLPDAPGRVDQYLYPCFASEAEAGTLDRDLAQELVNCLWIKYFESVGATSGVSAHNHLTLGGVRPDGSDASNEVTYLCLNAVEELKLLRPQVGVRWHKGTPPELLRRAVRALRSGTANPDFCSDEQIVHALVNVGVSLEDARDFSLSGCHEVIVTGKAQMGSVEGFINLPKILRMTLGLEPALQPDAELSRIDSFDDLWDALEASMDLVAEAAHLSSVGRDEAAARMPGGNLAASLVVQDCIERCLGYTQGGARYNFCNWDIIGTANLADSLAALRKLVFEKQALTLEEFVRVLEADWEGHETLRRRIATEVAHFGNQEAETDGLAARIIERFDAILKRRKPYRGGVYILGTLAGGENMHIEFGRITGATPDGRRAGDPVADSIGGAQGRDRSGVTALLNSVASLPHRLLPTATSLNVKLDPKLLSNDAGIDAVAALIQSHFSAGGQQMQFSFVNRQMLLEAKEKPELYRNLMVRVAGYSAPFTSLWEDMQDEIIARTEHVPA